MEPAEADTHFPVSPPDPRPERYRIVVVSPTDDESFALTSSYLERVWSEFLGPTSTLVARRIGHALVGSPAPILEATPTANSLGVAPSRIRWALTRLAEFELIGIATGPDVVVTSGHVVPLPTRLIDRLSPAGLEEHRRQLRPGAARQIALMSAAAGSSGGLPRGKSGRQL